MNTRRALVISMATLSGVCFGVAVSTFLLSNGYLGSTYRAYIVQSGSMAPALPVGSVVFTKSEPAYAVGDIVTFVPESSSNPVTHRIVSAEGSAFSTKGDANRTVDSGRVAPSQITGRAFLTVPLLGYLADFVKTPKGFVMLVVIPASIIIYEELKAIIRELYRSLFKKKKEMGNGNSSMAAVPLLGLLLLFAGSTSSFYADREQAAVNTFGAADNFDEEAEIDIEDD